MSPHASAGAPGATAAAGPVGLRASAVMDALTARAIVLDAKARIVAVNAAWRAFTAANGLGAADGGLGQDCLVLCAADGGSEAAAVAQAIHQVLSGAQPAVTAEFPGHGLGRGRGFRIQVTPLPLPGAGDGERGALVLHTDIGDPAASFAQAGESEARYRAMFERHALPMWVFDPATLRFLAVNDAAVAQYGYTRHEFLGMTLADIRPPEDVAALRADLADVQRHQLRESHQTWRHRRKDGTVLQVEVHAHELPWQGRPARLVMAEDVTQRADAEAALRESEQRFRQITECISEVFWLTEGERLLYVSPAYETIWQRSRDHLAGSGRRWLDTVHPDDRERVLAALPLQASGGYDIEYRILRPDGSVRWVADRAFPVPSPGDGPPPSLRLAGVTRDITARRANQARLSLLETAVARLNDLVLITEAEPCSPPGPRIVFVNDAFERRTGYARDEVLGQSPRLLQGPATQRSELDRIRSALEAWQPVRAELINYTKAGDPFWLELDIVPLADERGWFTHWVAIERDVTDRKRLEQQLQQSQRLEALGQLTGGVAHDFNNLLTVVLGNAELLMEQLPAGGLQQRLAQMIGSAAQRGAELTQRLLAFARKQALVPQVVDLNRLVADLDGLLRRTLGQEIELQHRTGSALWPTLADPAQLESALLNLAINARDAMPRGGRLRIQTQNTSVHAACTTRHAELEPGDYVMLSVTDTGCGIAPEHLARVFEPFFTTKERGKGTGLGLAMVYGFVKQSRGHVTLHSEPGQGTAVHICLPRHAGSPAYRRPPEEPEVPRGTGEVVLLVEDDPLVRSFASSQLEALHYRVLQATAGPEALALLRQHDDVALLFTDVVMPGGMNGAELAAAARALRPGLPVLYTSGYTENALTHDGRLDAGVLLLGKPYRRAELALKIQEALRAHPPAEPQESNA